MARANWPPKLFMDLHYRLIIIIFFGERFELHTKLFSAAKRVTFRHLPTALNFFYVAFLFIGAARKEK
jgi:hypothetical protein